MRLDRALDRFDGDLARRNCSPRSRRDYFWHLRRLFDHLPHEDPRTGDLTQDVIRDCLDEWANATPSTRYKVDAIFRSFCKWLYFNDLVERNPMDKLPRPKRTHPDDIPLRALSGSNVRRLFDACETWRELLCLSTLAYFGSRRGAVSRLRRRHLDFERGWITFHEKGAKVIDKPIPHAYLEIVQEAIAQGVIGDDPDAYVIPMLRSQRRKGDRDDRVIWRLIKTIGARRDRDPPPRPSPRVLRALPRAASGRDRSAATTSRPLEDRDDSALLASDGAQTPHGAWPRPQLGHPVRGHY